MHKPYDSLRRLCASVGTVHSASSLAAMYIYHTYAKHESELASVLLDSELGLALEKSYLHD